MSFLLPRPVQIHTAAVYLWSQKIQFFILLGSGWALKSQLYHKRLRLRNYRIYCKRCPAMPQHSYRGALKLEAPASLVVKLRGKYPKPLRSTILTIYEGGSEQTKRRLLPIRRLWIEFALAASSRICSAAFFSETTVSQMETIISQDLELHSIASINLCRSRLLLI